ncbi:hypothetical protein RhiirA5_412975 [Rhizophagus irregularis]|uniref:Uncharacterized protein n=1 Tax=Rhizophagus irregularis TaxID=588596 RepID=A0A2N0PXN5_9GLOM|nr:hypothetical protein RhiirA5_430835 [Rhizophagus irregularis]PKC11516.1 hypothetical protein RhiirA5_412975 [Rhizophagus irregularis]
MILRERKIKVQAVEAEAQLIEVKAKAKMTLRKHKIKVQAVKAEAQLIEVKAEVLKLEN